MEADEYFSTVDAPTQDRWGGGGGWGGGDQEVGISGLSR